MLSFPSTLNTGGADILLPSISKKSLGDRLKDMGRNAVNNLVNGTVNNIVGHLWGTLNGAQVNTALPNLEGLPYDRRRERAELAQQVNFADQGVIGDNMIMHSMLSSKAALGNWYENALTVDPAVYSLMNTYRRSFKNPVYVGGSKSDEGDYLVTTFDGGTLSPSLFNPFYGIQKIGPTRNTPLLNDKKRLQDKDSQYDFDWEDCSIAKLCSLSALPNGGGLGQARYKFSDFMYCKDLGMPNNRMITLRRFSQPVNDIININKSGDGYGSRYSIPGDIGRLIGYFDTEENKLEDILQYSFSTTWRDLSSEIQQEDSQEDARNSPLGMILNTMSSGYRKNYLQSTAGGNGDGNNLFDWGLQKIGIKTDSNWYQGHKMLTNYDKNKIYEPINTIRDMSVYEGKLQFNHEFTLTFVYTLRSYDNINPKAAFLDLISNITQVCYKRGSFWGGRQEIIGAQPNIAGWKVANGVIDNTFETLGGLWNMAKHSSDYQKTMQEQAENKQNQEAQATEAAQQNKDVKAQLAELVNTSKDVIKGVLGAAGQFLKGFVQNKLGRPNLYAFNSLLTGDDTGLWHVTIGNPRNPIISMGNLIVTNTTVQHFGPLGADDFPTGIKVTVTLKHARPRDMMDIQKMYTRGMSSIYVPLYGGDSTESNKGETVHVDTSKHFPSDPSEGNLMYIGDDNIDRIKRNLEELL